MASAKVVPFAQLGPLFLRAHKPGEHVAIVGRTGGGKSVLGLELCKLLATRTQGRQGAKRPASVTVLATKPRDATLARLHKAGWPIIKKWPPAYGQEHCIVWPRGGPPSGRARRLRAVYQPLLDRIYSEGNQAVFIDEAAYFERQLPNGLGLQGTMEEFWTTARSSKLTLLAGTQRPRRVTRSMWSEPSWLFVFRPNDLDDLKRVAELSGRREQVLEIVPGLGRYEFLVVRRQPGGIDDLYISKVGT